MGFAQKNLNEGEELILDFRPHWRRLTFPALWTLAIAIVFGLLVKITPQSWKSSLPLMAVYVIGAALAWLVLALPPILRWMATEYVLTDERLVTRHGVFRKITHDIPIEQVNSVMVRQGIIDRIANVGTLRIESASDSGDIVIRDIPNPTDVQNMISRTKENRAVRLTPPADAGVAGRLESLEEMHSRGLISDEEYATKRTDLLGRI